MKDEFLFFSFLFLFLEMAAKSELRGLVGGENKIKKQARGCSDDTGRLWL